MTIRHIAAVIFAAVTILPVAGQKPGKVVPAGSRIDVESLNRNIDTSMDISDLSLQDLRILRNAFAARQGYCFADYALRAVFRQTSWYDSMLWRRLEGDLYEKPIKYTAAETAFVNRIKAREAELRARNFAAGGGARVNVDNIVNKFQLEEVSEPLMRRLGRDGFAIVPRQNIQLFHCYENNDYHDFPSFVTTDMHLQLLHVYFSCVMQEVESRSLMPLTERFCREMYSRMDRVRRIAGDKHTRRAAVFCASYFAVAMRLAGDTSAVLPEEYRQTVEEETARVMRGEDALSPFLGYTDAEFMYSMFRPRGYYTRSEAMKRYFRTMMWLQRADGCISRYAELDRFVLMAGELCADRRLMNMLDSISGSLTLLAGQPDGVSLADIAGIMARRGLTCGGIMRSKRAEEDFQAELLAMSRRMTRIRSKVQLSCAEKMAVLPQRYAYDSEVLQELVDTETLPETLRGCPAGLDVMAAFGSQAAESILVRELKTQEQWPEYTERLRRMKTLMPALGSDSTVYNMWMKALADIAGEKDARSPYFMRTPQWAKKCLNTALASWTELKHDMALYSKQPMAAECGGAIPDPVVVGYVELDAAYWRKALSLLRRTADVLERSGLMTARVRNLAAQMEEQTLFLLNISEKELAGRRLTNEEFKSIEKIGSTYEWLTLDILRDSASASGMKWEDVQGPDRSVAVTADVYTANAPNNPHKSVLHGAVGYVDDIFVVVEINGMLHLTRGAVFSYRELNMPPGQRLTDEEWQGMLEKEPRRGVPSWMDGIILADPVPADNELIFYSSGC